jgi:hypothetical protein
MDSTKTDQNRSKQVKTGQNRSKQVKTRSKQGQNKVKTGQNISPDSLERPGVAVGPPVILLRSSPAPRPSVACLCCCHAREVLSVWHATLLRYPRAEYNCIHVHTHTHTQPHTTHTHTHTHKNKHVHTMEFCMGGGRTTRGGSKKTFYFWRSTHLREVSTC